MCDCIDKIHEKAKEQFPSINRLPENYELSSERMFSAYGFQTKVKGCKNLMVMYSYCPFCGDKYPDVPREG